MIRALNYRVDWVAPTGASHTSPKIAHDWVPITDSEKVAILDSARASDSALTARYTARRDSIARLRGTDEPAGAARVISCCGGESFQIGNETPFSVVWATLDDLPDYVRPLVETLNAVRGDADGNLWITTYQVHRLPGGPVYDIVNRDGVLVDRVQIPGGTYIAGFGSGVVYLGSREGNGYKLARVRIQ